MDRTTMRGLDSSSSEDDDDDDASEEQSESDSDRRRFSSQQHLPVSVKRRKVSVDEDYERLHLLEQPDEIETRPINTQRSPSYLIHCNHNRSSVNAAVKLASEKTEEFHRRTQINLDGNDLILFRTSTRRALLLIIVVKYSWT
ncbi:hypothetical protein BGX24_009695 [Mortierella sp. AD032]|nr:hypothetical protein BGX24_009695 [Mortierella sp. AD032]